MFGKFAVLAVIAAGLSGCDAQVGQNSNQTFSNGARPGQAGFTVVPAGAPSGAVVNNFAMQVLNDIQPQSIAQEREYCGYIFVTPTGQLNATPPRLGTLTGCEMPEPLIGQGMIASYHTHGAYNPVLGGEFPSDVDLISDFNYGTDGFIGTPGGRVWHVDFQTRTAYQLCGQGCITSDSAFRGDVRAVPATYTLR